MITNCPISGFEIETNPNWIFYSQIDKGYSVEVSFINKNIVHLEVSGAATDGNKLEVWPQVSALISSQLGQQKYFLIHNYLNFKGGNSSARNFYIKWVNYNIQNIHSIYFFNSSPLLKIQINAGKLFSKNLRKTYILDNYKQVILDIKQQIRSNIDINTNSGTIIAKPIREWVNTYSITGYRSKTFLYKGNLIIRKFYGTFDDTAMPELIKSLDIINFYDTIIE